MTTAKNRIKPSHIIYLLLSVFLLVAVRWMWHDYLSLPDSPSVKQGVLDLRGEQFKDLSSFPLGGEWLFYPEQWVSGTNIDDAPQGKLLQVPGNWNAAVDPAGGRAYGHGTYHVRIVLDRPLSRPLGIWFHSIYTAVEVEINGEVLAQFGELAEQREGHVSKTESFLVTYANTHDTELNLFVRTSNYESPLIGGIVKSVQFGPKSSVEGKYLYSAGFQLIVFVILMLHAVYALIIYLMNVRSTEIMMFCLMVVAAAMTISVYHHGLLLAWFDVGFAWQLKLKAFAFMGFSLFLLLMGRGLAGDTRRRPMLHTYFVILTAYTLFIAVGPEQSAIYSIEKEHYMILYYVPLFWTGYYFIKMVFSKVKGSLFLLFSILCVINNILWGIVYYAGTAQFMFYPVDLIAAITSFSAYWFKRYIHNSNENVLLNARLAEANRVKDRFLANTSHELRTPLHGILNIAQSVLTRKKDALDDQSQRDMELLIRVSRRMSHMLNDLLDVVRLQDKRIVVHMTAVRVQSLAAGVLDMLRFVADGTKVELRMNVADDLPNVYADEERLVQILINLVHNALKYTKEGTVELATKQDGGYVWIQVKDTGAGMDEAMQKRAYLPYEQGTFGGGGIGLGLSICKELVELHGSELKLQSQPGQGSVFSFKLKVFDKKLESAVPAHAMKEESPSVYVSTQTEAEMTVGYEIKDIRHIQKLPTGTDRTRVLIVDDDPVNLKVLIHILSEEAYYIETAFSAREALDKLHRDQWDLVIADVMMPDISGYELTRTIRERFTLYELPVILLTARGEPEDIYAGFVAGTNDYVTKPVDALELNYRAWSLSSLKRAVNDRLRMEAAYLQAQIHPHFLFNTLNSILALSDIDSDKMRKLADAFTSYLRISFDFLTAGRLVPLSRELQLVENYLYIEQQRFEERLQVEWEVGADVEVMIPPLSVQPLVENAVRHGALSLSEGGTVRIRIERQEDAVHFSVADTGVGMNDEQIGRLLSPEGKEYRGIGLFNTHSRLTQLYGQGLQIQSKPDKGTTVSFAISERKIE